MANPLQAVMQVQILVAVAAVELTTTPIIKVVMEVLES
jgi:hypothetical protein